MKGGAGVFFGLGNEQNRSFTFDGPQTNQRAELSAVLHCLLDLLQAVERLKDRQDVANVLGRTRRLAAVEELRQAIVQRWGNALDLVCNSKRG